MMLRRSLYRQLETAAWTAKGISPTNRTICGLIIASALFAIFETEPTLSAGREQLFVLAERTFTAIFVVEYLARVWVSVENPQFGPGFPGRLRYIMSGPAILDLLAILPIILTFAGSEVFLLRLFRFTRLLRVARLGRFSRATHHIIEAISSRRHELMVSLMVAGLVLVATSTMLYLIEGDVQPEAFGSIPRAMWWSVATLTTVGYGDVYPHTPLGRVFAALTAIMGIGLIAMPTGILAAAFSDAVQRANSAVQQHEGASEKLKRPAP